MVRWHTDIHFLELVHASLGPIKGKHYETIWIVPHWLSNRTRHPLLNIKIYTGHTTDWCIQLCTQYFINLPTFYPLVIFFQPSCCPTYLSKGFMNVLGSHLSILGHRCCTSSWQVFLGSVCGFSWWRYQYTTYQQSFSFSFLSVTWSLWKKLKPRQVELWRTLVSVCFVHCSENRFLSLILK